MNDSHGNCRERYIKQEVKIKINTIHKENMYLIRMDQQLLNDQLAFEISDYKMLTIKAMFLPARMSNAAPWRPDSLGNYLSHSISEKLQAQNRLGAQQRH